MVGRGDADRVDGWIGQDLSEVPNLFRLMTRAPGRGGGAFEVGLKDIANGADRHAGLVHGGLKVLRTHDADADEGGRNPIVRGDRSSRKGGGSGRSSCRTKEGATREMAGWHCSDRTAGSAAGWPALASDRPQLELGELHSLRLHFIGTQSRRLVA